MRTMRARLFESTPGQLYWRRSEPERISTRNGRSAEGSRPLSSLGFTSTPSRGEVCKPQAATGPIILSSQPGSGEAMDEELREQMEHYQQGELAAFERLYGLLAPR